MKKYTVMVIVVGILMVFSAIAPMAYAATAAELDRSSQAALSDLYAKTPGAKELGATAKGILVFPKIVKGGFIIGGQGGEGALIVNGKTQGSYSSAGVSYGLQIGVQKFGYALFFMSDADLQYLRSSKGWEIGVGPSIVIVDAGKAANLSTTTAKNGVYAFFFSQKGLMAGLGLQGTKISKFEASKG